MKRSRTINKIFLTILFYIIYAIIWYFVFWGATEFFYNGFHTTLEDFYGPWSIWLGISIAIIIFISPIYMRKWIKKEVLVPLVSIIISTLFLLISFGGYSIAYKSFTEFTSEKWQKYERQRLIMLNDLRTNHISNKTTQNEIIKILGKPSNITNDGNFEYNYDYGDIMVYFDENIVLKIEGTNLFGKSY